MHRSKLAQPNRFHASIRVLVAASAPLVLATSQAPALAAAVQPAEAVEASRATAWYIVTEDNAALRCGARESGFYKVAELEAGTWLAVDADAPGVSAGWLRAAYPEWVYPFIKPETVRAIDDRTLEVIRPAKVLQPNLLVGAAGSWRSMFSEPLPVGTELRLAETLRLEDGSVASYRIHVPTPPPGADPARAFIKASAVRAATPDEVAERLAAQQPAEDAGSTEPAEQATPPADDTTTTPPKPDIATGTEPGADIVTDPANGEDAPAPAPVIDLTELQADPAPASETPSDEGDAGADDAASDDADASLLDEMVDSVDLSAVGLGDGPGDAPADAASTPDAGDAGTETQPEPAAVPPLPAVVVDETPAYLSVAELDRTFNSIRRLRGAESRPAIDELIAEYQRTRATTSSARIQQAIDQRVKILNLRLSILDAAAEAAAAIEASKQRSGSVSRDLTRWRSNRQYTLVGRLVPSLLYDGERLPLMYRMESIASGPGPRTLGYVRPDLEEVRVGVLGEVVGVIGSSRYDDALKLLVVTPSRIDVLEPTERARP